MKRLMIPVLTGIGLCFAQMAAHAQEFKEHISKQFTLQKPATETLVGVFNIFGSIKVEGYSGNQVMIEIDKTITADDQENLEKGKKDFKLEFEQKADSLLIYSTYPWNTRPHHRNDNIEWHEHIHYNVKLEYTVKVPFASNLWVSTVNSGNIDVKNVYGSLKTNNVNGGITIANAKGTTIARTVNGPVTINYLSVPPEASNYYTLNGKLEVTYPASLSADLEFKSMNGEFYTDFPNAEVLPSKVVKTQSKNNNGTTYKLSQNSDVRIGSGGKLFKFETLNGNIYIKKQQ
ncbi:MAG TPA: hypothetical protein VK668_15415 [Mucilaginibacter sp.]|nr:hypothetical protein [Mucilaginibacter sp.]